MLVTNQNYTKMHGQKKYETKSLREVSYIEADFNP